MASSRVALTSTGRVAAHPSLVTGRRLVPVHGPCCSGRGRKQQLRAVEADIAPVPAAATTLHDVKAALLDALHGTDRGLSARSEVRAEINELISQLEAKNPAADPKEVLAQLNGTWRLYYTSNSELIAVLALGKLPLVQVGDITQKIDVATNSVENTVQLTVAFSKTSVSTTAVYDVRSPKRLQLRFDKGIVQTPRLLSDIDVPSTITVLGQAVDLSPLKSALQPLSDRVADVIHRVSDVIAQTPDLQIPISGDQAQTWLLNTYVDNNMRISRGDGGSVFLCVKDE